MEGYLTSLVDSDREKNATGLPSWFNVAARATFDASVSTTNGLSSSIVATTESSISCFKLLNASRAGFGRGKVVLLDNGFILVENL